MRFNFIHSNRKSTWRIPLLLFTLWFVATAFNITKPYHIDDTGHLEIAEWLAEHPTHPMSGYINWGDSPAPIHLLNQPHLYFYLLGFYIKLFGVNEITTHLFQSFFTLLAIVFFYKLVCVHCQKHVFFPVFFLALCPAFVVGQNLMTDVPLLSLWILFYYVLTTDRIRSEWATYLLAGLIASAAVLIKYTSLPLIPAIFLAILFRKDFRYLYMGLIPVVALALWSLFNYFDYGGIHLLSRPISGFSIERLRLVCLSWVLCMGAIAPFTLALASGCIVKIRPRCSGVLHTFLWGVALLPILLFTLFVSNWLSENQTDFVLRSLFFVNGLLVLSVIIYVVLRYLKACCALEMEKIYTELILLYWFFSGVAFVVLFAPFMATRHVLLVLPPAIILLHKYVMFQGRKTFHVLSLLCSISLTLMLAVSDFSFANFYKKNAEVIAEKLEGETVWFSGHWGWQWYARANGMRQIDPHNLSAVQPGDYLAYPEKIHQQGTKIASRLILFDDFFEVNERRSWWEYVSTASPARFYISSWRQIPWNFSRDSFGPIIIFRVKNIISDE